MDEETQDLPKQVLAILNLLADLSLIETILELQPSTLFDCLDPFSHIIEAELARISEPLELIGPESTNQLTPQLFEPSALCPGKEVNQQTKELFVRVQRTEPPSDCLTTTDSHLLGHLNQYTLLRALVLCPKDSPGQFRAELVNVERRREISL